MDVPRISPLFGAGSYVHMYGMSLWTFINVVDRVSERELLW
jgi:hypothetical protein